MKVNLIRVNGAMKIAFLLICYLATCVQLNAQAPKLVMGRILDKEASEKKRKPVPFDISSIGDIKIYYFNTVQEGKDMEAALNKDNISLTRCDGSLSDYFTGDRFIGYQSKYGARCI